MSADTLAIALTFAEGARPAFPWVKGATGKKTPLKGTDGHRDATTDAAKISGWFAGPTRAGVALANGPAGITVIDIDVPTPDKPDKANGFQTMLDRGLELPDTLTIRTPSGGLHAYYLDPYKTTRWIGMFPSVDRLGDGGWTAFYGDLADAQRIADGDLAVLPEWASHAKPSDTDTPTGAPYDDGVDAWLAECAPGKPCRHVSAALDRFDPRPGTAHDPLINVQRELIGYGASGHPGAPEALAAAFERYDTARPGQAAEWLAGLRGAVAKFGEHSHVTGLFGCEDLRPAPATDTPATTPPASPEITPADDRAGDWMPVDLTETIDAVVAGTMVAPTPTIGVTDDGMGLIYAGKVNGLAGDSGAGKTWIAFRLGVEQMKAGRQFIYLDAEDNQQTAVVRLWEMGTPAGIIRERFKYVHPTAHDTREIAKLIDLITTFERPFVTIDSTGEAMGLAGINPNADQEVAAWFQALPKPLAAAGATVFLLDHLTKAADGKLFPTGSQRKRASITGVQLIAEAVAPFSRTSTDDGVVLLKVTKDRGGAREAGSIASTVRFERQALIGRLNIVLGRGMSKAEIEQRTDENKAGREADAIADLVAAARKLNPVPTSKRAIMAALGCGDVRARAVAKALSGTEWNGAGTSATGEDGEGGGTWHSLPLGRVPSSTHPITRAEIDGEAS